MKIDESVILKIIFCIASSGNCSKNRWLLIWSWMIGNDRIWVLLLNFSLWIFIQCSITKSANHGGLLVQISSKPMSRSSQIDNSFAAW